MKYSILNWKEDRDYIMSDPLIFILTLLKLKKLIKGSDWEDEEILNAIGEQIIGSSEEEKTMFAVILTIIFDEVMRSDDFQFIEKTYPDKIHYTFIISPEDVNTKMSIEFNFKNQDDLLIFENLFSKLITDMKGCNSIVKLCWEDSYKRYHPDAIPLNASEAECEEDYRFSDYDIKNTIREKSHIWRIFNLYLDLGRAYKLEDSYGVDVDDFPAAVITFDSDW